VNVVFVLVVAAARTHIGQSRRSIASDWFEVSARTGSRCLLVYRTASESGRLSQDDISIKLSDETSNEFQGTNKENNPDATACEHAVGGDMPC